jgi:TPR repeat protein
MKTAYALTIVAAIFVISALAQDSENAAEPSLKELQATAEKGDASAQYKLGLRYSTGEGVPQDKVEGYKWLHIAVEQGNAAAVFPRYELATPLTQEEIKEAQQRARRFLDSRRPPSAPPKQTSTTRVNEEPPRDIVDLIREKKIEIKTQGAGIKAVGLQVRQIPEDYVSLPKSISVRVPVGTLFTANKASSQNMITTAERTVSLSDSGWVSVDVPAACANREKAIPKKDDSFQVARSSHQAELSRLMPAIDKANVDYATRQAAVWIVTDDATYSDLGTLITRPAYSSFGGARTIHEAETARAMKICDEVGIDITRKRIWRDKQTVLRGLNDEKLKQWLEAKQ